MDISAIVNYESLFEVHIRNPATDEPTGIVMQVRSADSIEAREIQRKLADKNLERLQRGKVLTAKQLEHQETERAASYIASWDWGENTFRGEVPQFSTAKAIEILSATGWLEKQVTEAAQKIENFTQA